MRVRLMLTCLCDAYFGEVGIATARVLEHAGCEVVFPKAQTCCGQPPFNAGDWASARHVSEHWLEVFAGDDPVVTPSASCAAMIRDGYKLLFGRRTDIPVFELAEFLVLRLGIERWPLGFAPAPLKRELVAFHRACHGRAIEIGEEQVILVRSLSSTELVEIPEPEQCCGFGGAFAINHPTISARIGREKLAHVAETGALTLVSGDMGCLMHLRGLIEREGLPIRTLHFAELLAEAIPASVPA